MTTAMLNAIISIVPGNIRIKWRKIILAKLPWHFYPTAMYIETEAIIRVIRDKVMVLIEYLDPDVAIGFIGYYFHQIVD